MAYKLLGPRRMVGVADTTGNNTGNWTVTFDPLAINVNVWPQFEVYKIVIKTKSAQFVINFDVFIGSQQWDSSFVPAGGIVSSNSWDPVNPIVLRPGQYLYFYLAEPATDGTPPTITIWLRYESDIAAEQIG